nr:MAG TPA: hypothetical protein [Caudoviricetes sp.]
MSASSSAVLYSINLKSFMSFPFYGVTLSLWAG